MRSTRLKATPIANPSAIAPRNTNHKGMPTTAAARVTSATSNTEQLIRAWRRTLMRSATHCCHKLPGNHEIAPAVTAAPATKSDVPRTLVSISGKNESAVKKLMFRPKENPTAVPKQPPRNARGNPHLPPPHPPPHPPTAPTQPH